MKLLVVAAEAREFRGILAHARRKPGELAGERVCPTRQQGGTDAFVCQPTGLLDFFTASVALGAHDLLLVANGAGPARAAATVDRAAAAFLPDAIVSTGFCGALDEELGVASVVVATEVLDANGRFSALAPAASLAHHLGAVVTIDHVAQSAAEKRSLRQTGASAVDMEAAAVAGRAAALSLPFFCIKAVTDLAGEDMANDLNAAMRPDGHFDTMRILGSSLGRPLSRVPELLRLRSRSARAACALGDFFADCRF
jgi:adenosylhomocysteine nucleosidase